MYMFLPLQTVHLLANKPGKACMVLLLTDVKLPHLNKYAVAASHLACLIRV